MGLVGGGLYPNLPYHATKGAVVNMTRALAAEWAARGVRVNAIAPTFANTDLTVNLRRDADMVGRIEDRTPMGRYGEPDDLIGVLVWLLSDATRFVTGIVVPVDGGFSAYTV